MSRRETGTTAVLLYVWGVSKLLHPSARLPRKSQPQKPLPGATQAKRSKRSASPESGWDCWGCCMGEGVNGRGGKTISSGSRIIPIHVLHFPLSFREPSWQLPTEPLAAFLAPGQV